MLPLEFTATATLRPEVLRQSFATFYANLAGVDWQASTLHLNVDPVPAGHTTAEGVAAVASEFFGTVAVNFPRAASFPAAVKWCWSRPKGEFFFHLEDDWQLDRSVSVYDLREQLSANAGLSLVNLRAYPHHDDRLCLAPGLWRTAHARSIADRLRLDANPERQMRPVRHNNPHGGAHAGFKGLQFPPDRKAIVIKDIGRTWLEKQGWRRAGGRNFTQWVGVG